MRKVPSVYGQERGFKEAYTWKQIDPRVLELGSNRLHRKVQGEDLFAREAQFHPFSRKSFNLKYADYFRDTARATSCDKTDTDQDRKGSAHLKAFTALPDYFQD